MDKNIHMVILGALEGFKIRFKELHWAAVTMVEHKLADDILSSLNSFQDEFAEEGFGIFGNPEIGDLIIEQIFTTNIIDTLDYLLNVLNQARKSAENFPGLLGITDAYIHDINKFKYLAKLQ